MAVLASPNVPRAPTWGASLRACLRAPASRIVPKATAAVRDAPALGEQLLGARKIAMDLFVAIESKGILAPGCTETDIDKQVFDLAAAHFGTRKHWHQRLPRVGQNTIHPIYDKVADVALQEDDIVYVDLGPVFGDMEADFGRTYVLGDDAEKHKLNAALEQVFNKCKQHYLSNPSMTGAEFFKLVRKTSSACGYEYANPNYCAHLVGKFSHDLEFGDDPQHYACPECSTPMNALGPDGQERMWILEIHLLQEPGIGKYGGFYEDLLNLPT